MSEVKVQMEAFFAEYARTNDGGDYEREAGYFAPAFVAAGPAGAQVVKRDDFAAALPKRKQMFEAWGQKGATLKNLEVTELDTRRVLAMTEWRMDFELKDGRKDALDVKSIFLVEENAGRWEIVLYQACQDIVALVRARGWME
ncbi:MAG: DUF4440 domain-containing protein [Acidobacteriota bacterium]|nr:DUF4440 domain-containing protein [Acidobacteriota bacterium]